jgi:ASC-1-like (ASCH) protein
VAKVHHLKTWTPYFQDIKSGVKQFEVRKNDRDFQVGDTLILDDFDPNTEKYLGQWIPKLVTYKLDDVRFVKEGFVILGMQDIIF